MKFNAYSPIVNKFNENQLQAGTENFDPFTCLLNSDFSGASNFHIPALFM